MGETCDHTIDPRCDHKIDSRCDHKIDPRCDHKIDPRCDAVFRDEISLPWPEVSVDGERLDESESDEPPSQIVARLHRAVQNVRMAHLGPILWNYILAAIYGWNLIWSNSSL
jgi:hypothetical protein